MAKTDIVGDKSYFPRQVHYLLRQSSYNVATKNARQQFNHKNGFVNLNLYMYIWAIKFNNYNDYDSKAIFLWIANPLIGISKYFTRVNKLDNI